MKRVSASVFLLLALTFAVAPIANAHTTLLSSVPASNAEVTEAPTSIELEFGEDLIALGKGTKVSVIAPSGKDIAMGSATVDKTHVSQPLTFDSTPGVYTVKFRVVAADGHVLEDTYAFTITAGQSASALAAPIMKPTAHSSGAEEAEEGVGSEEEGGNFLVKGFLVLATLVIIVLIVRRWQKRQR